MKVSSRRIRSQPLELSFLALIGIIGCGDTAPPARDDIPTLETFCDEMSRTLCEVCNIPQADCEFASDCLRNAGLRDGGGYSATKGTSCLSDLEQINCSTPPLNCEGNLAIASCNDYLDGTTTQTCN